MTLKAKFKIKIKNPLTYILPTYQHTYLPSIYLFIYNLSTYLRIFYPPTHLFTYIPTYLHKLKLIFKKMPCANFNYPKWQFLITWNDKMWVGYILIAKMELVTNCTWMINGWDHICWPYTSSMWNVLTSWWIIICD